MKKQMSVRFPESLAKKIKVEAATREITIEKLINEAVVAHLSKEYTKSCDICLMETSRVVECKGCVSQACPDCLSECKSCGSPICESCASLVKLSDDETDAYCRDCRPASSVQ